MVALWIILGVVAAIVLLLGLILLMPIDLLFILDEKEGFALRIRLLGMIFGGGEEADAENSLVKAVKKALGLSHLESTDSLRSAVKKQGATETLQETVKTLMDLIERAFWLLKRCRIAACRLTFTAGGEDAPLEYGTACAVIYPLVAFLEGAGRLKPRNKEVRILCDYDRPESILEGQIAVRVHIWYLARALMHIIKKNVEKQV